MAYSLIETTQKYGEQSYQAFKLAADNPADEQHFFGQRIPGYGIINFGYSPANQTKTISLAEAGIHSPISVVSAIGFTASNKRSTNDQITFTVQKDNVDLGRLLLRYDQMPFQFPSGAILTPDLSITIKPETDMPMCLIYWQPVFIIHEFTYGGEEARL